MRQHKTEREFAEEETRDRQEKERRRGAFCTRTRNPHTLAVREGTRSLRRQLRRKEDLWIRLCHVIRRIAIKDTENQEKEETKHQQTNLKKAAATATTGTERP